MAKAKSWNTYKHMIEDNYRRGKYEVMVHEGVVVEPVENFEQLIEQLL